MDPLVASVLTSAGAVDVVEPIDDDVAPATLAVASPVPTNVDMLDLVNKSTGPSRCIHEFMEERRQKTLEIQQKYKILRRTAQCTMRESVTD